MSEEFRLFHSFQDAELVNEFAAKLKEAGIEYKIEKAPALVSDFIIGSTPASDISINLRSKDFEKAHEVLGNYYKPQLDLVDKDHYLFAFTDQELYEILEKPDEWGYLDYQLANKILTDRGRPVDGSTLQNLKSERIKELAKPGKASSSLIILGYCFFFFAGIPTILIGRHIIKDKKVLPNGELVSSFTEKDKKHGRRMIRIGTFVLCLIIILLILQIFISPAETE